ncbi:MAG: hypothetical protein CM1200mP2_59320 [Planctomycetaceae bacterium]|nr:MAG: hypothetical protein CM1200mP2_59320 [Planctomycetaceae bacterium]
MDVQRTRRRVLPDLGFGGPLRVSGALASSGGRPPAKEAPGGGRVYPVLQVFHADVLVGKDPQGWRQAGGPGPGLELVSMYVDQFSERTRAGPGKETRVFPIARTIDEAVTLGTNRVSPRRVLSVGEHGDYPYTPETKQQSIRVGGSSMKSLPRCDAAVNSCRCSTTNTPATGGGVPNNGRHGATFPHSPDGGLVFPVTWRYPGPKGNPHR